MKIGIIGLANSGKTTVFNALTGLQAPVTAFANVDAEPNVGVVKVPDARVDHLARIYRPSKVTNAVVEYVDHLGIIRGDARQNRKVIDMIKDVDAVLHVVRGFEDESIPHPLGRVDPRADAAAVEVELVFSDLELVEKRLERIAEAKGKGRRPEPGEEEMLKRCREALESETALRKVDFSEGEHRAMRHLQFISVKPELILLNTGEGDAGSGEEAVLLEDLHSAGGLPVIGLPGKIEMEISQLSPEEAAPFLQELGIGESAMARVIKLCYEELGLISFLTVIKNEVRAWTVARGTSALHAAGRVHTDMERGFIRAEVVSFEDFSAAGGMSGARERGRVRLEGKNYVVRDGDIINFRFNV